MRRFTRTSLLVAVVGLCLAAPARAAESVVVRGFPPEMLKETFTGKFLGKPIGKKSCYAPRVCLADGETLPRIPVGVAGYPNFLPGEVVLANGARITGKVLVDGEPRDWDFVKRWVYVVPEGETEAYYMLPGSVAEVAQVDGGRKVFDAYGDAYLQRLISGPLRLSYNPAAGTSAKVAEFITPGVLEEAQQRAYANQLLGTLKAGGSLAEARAKADLKQDMVNVVSSIEITEKEYLLFDTATRTTRAITKASYAATMKAVFAACAKADPAQASALSQQMSQIEKAVAYLNATCF